MKLRKDEKVVYDVNQIHHLTAVRNFLHAVFVPHPGLAGPLFTAGTATVAERYKYGRKAMDCNFFRRQHARDWFHCGRIFHPAHHVVSAVLADCVVDYTHHYRICVYQNRHAGAPHRQ